MASRVSGGSIGSGLLRRLPGRVPARRGKQRWAEKTPGYTFHLDLIDELFPNAQYVHVIRDGRDVVASFRDRWGYQAGLRAANSVWRESCSVPAPSGSGCPPAATTSCATKRSVADPEREMRRLLDVPRRGVGRAVLHYDECAARHTERTPEYSAERRAECRGSGGTGSVRGGSGASGEWRGRGECSIGQCAPCCMRSSGKGCCSRSRLHAPS